MLHNGKVCQLKTGHRSLILITFSDNKEKINKFTEKKLPCILLGNDSTKDSPSASNRNVFTGNVLNRLV